MAQPNCETFKYHLKSEPGPGPEPQEGASKCIHF
jgi:hypothetical protein